MMNTPLSPCSGHFFEDDFLLVYAIMYLVNVYRPFPLPRAVLEIFLTMAYA